MTPEEAERLVLDRELFGMRFGLDRMRRLMTVLGSPQLSFESIHVVGSNGKSSTTRMIAAILARHGLRTGAYLSPHLVSFGERIMVDQAPLEPGQFAVAIQRAARAAELVDRSPPPGERVTQFELLTAAAYSEFASRGVDVSVVEAGLGGRYDATNVIPSRVQVLTSVGLEHTRWLGPTIKDIAGEKLDVVRGSGTLVVGHGLHPDAERVAAAVSRERGARIVHAPADAGVALGAAGGFQRRNFALARAAAEAYLEELDESAVAAAAAETLIPGRLEVIGRHPLTVLDGAHNAEGMQALVESIPELVAAEGDSPGPRASGGRGPVVAVLSILADKDAAGMLSALLPLCQAVVLTSSHNPRALPPATLQSLTQQLGGPASEIVLDPVQALARASEMTGSDGVVLATGSLYLVAELVRPLGSRRASML